MSHARYFIPACLYPHTKYRTRAGVMALFQKFALEGNEYMIVMYVLPLKGENFTRPHA